VTDGEEFDEEEEDARDEESGSEAKAKKRCNKSRPAERYGICCVGTQRVYLMPVRAMPSMNWRWKMA
jgi:hypothetical protein